MYNKYYLHIDSRNIAYYFGSACIMPDKYIHGRAEDVQSAYPDYLLLCSVKEAVQFDSAIELILTKDEESKLIRLPTFKELFLLASPLPVSRVTAVYFKDIEQKDKIVTLINLSTAFLPKRITKLFDNDNLFDYSGLNFSSPKAQLDYKDKLSLYNSLLGGFSIMKLAREPYMNYSENYFSTLSFFNREIEEQLLKSRKVNSIYHDVFIGKDSFRQLAPLLKRQINEEDINTIAHFEKQTVKKDIITGLIDLNSLERATYIIAVLYTYGLGDEGRKNKIDGLLLNNFQREIKHDRAEVVALCYGLNRGYSSFSNRYKSINHEVSVKFELNSKLDYYTIESLFQYAVNDVTKSEIFGYIEQYWPEIKNQQIKIRKSDYYIFDKLIISERTELGSQKWWAKTLQIFFQKNQIDLFRPFLESFYEKVRDDFDDEYSNHIEMLKSDIEKAYKENKDLKIRLKQLEDKAIEVDNTESHKRDLQEIRSTITETSINHDKNNVLQEELQTINNKLNESKRLLKSLLSLIKGKEATKLINDYFDKQNNSSSELFNNK